VSCTEQAVPKLKTRAVSEQDSISLLNENLSCGLPTSSAATPTIDYMGTYMVVLGLTLNHRNGQNRDLGLI